MDDTGDPIFARPIFNFHFRAVLVELAYIEDVDAYLRDEIDTG